MKMAHNKKRLLFLFYGFIFLVMFVLSFLTPLSCDDYTYCFSWSDGSRIHSLSQIISSMAAHRVSTNGRVVAHSIVQFVLMYPKLLFDCLNALMAVLICALLERYCVDLPPSQKVLILLFVLLFLWIFTPVYSAVFLWLDGSINYFWGMGFLLLFLWPFSSDYLGFPTKSRWPVVILQCLLSFLAGSYSENSSMAFFLIACVLFLLNWHKSRIFPIQQLLFLLFAAAGYLFLVKAPATATRAISPSISLIGFQIREIISYAKENLLIPWCVFSILFALAFSFGARREILVFSMLLFLGSIAALAAYIFAAYFIPRHMFCTVFLSTVAISVLLGELIRLHHPIPGRLLLACTTLLFIISFTEGLLDIGVTFHRTLQREAVIKAAMDSGENSITLETWQPYTKYAIDFPLQYGDDPYVWPNTDVAHYYGFDAVYGVKPLN